MNMRGSIPRRKPDPTRRPEPRPIIQKAPQNIYFDAGDLLIPLDGSVKLFETRFARRGALESPALTLFGLAPQASLWLQVMDEEGTLVFEQEIKHNGRTNFQDVPVTAYTKYGVWLAQKDAESEIRISADLVFVFQEA